MKTELLKELAMLGVDAGAQAAHDNLYGKLEKALDEIRKLEKEFDAFFYNQLEKNSRYKDVIKNTRDKFCDILEDYVKWKDKNYYYDILKNSKVVEYDKNCLVDTLYLAKVARYPAPIVCKLNKEKVIFEPLYIEDENFENKIIKILRII